MILRRMVRLASVNWESFVNTQINKVKDSYTISEHGLDLSKQGFLKKEVYRSDECVCIEKEDKVVGFAFLFTHKRPRALYISLMASFEKGIGRYLIDFLTETRAYPHEYIALRATINSIGFYMKCDFKVFDFISLEDYVNGHTDSSLSNYIIQYMENKEMLQKIQRKIVEYDWMPEESEEFPLLKKRSTVPLYIGRTSPRFS